MSKGYILTTSGFILPDSEHYTVLDESKVNSTSIFDKKTFVSTDVAIQDFLKTNAIYHSDVANDAYKKYISEPTFEHFIQLVDISSSVLSGVDFQTFFDIQANNKNLSPTSFMFCLNLYSGSFFTNYRMFETVPLNGRFSSEVNPQKHDATKLKVYGNCNRMTWTKFLSELSVYREAYVSFYRYVFVDAY